MEYCRYHKGKKKKLSAKESNSSNSRKNYVKQIGRLHSLYDFLEDLIDTTVHAANNDVFEELKKFLFENNDRESNGFIRTAVLRCGYLDCLNIGDQVALLCNSPLICCTASVDSLYSLVEDIRRKSTSGVVHVLLEQAECIPGSFIDDLVTVLSEEASTYDVVLLMTISTDISSIYSRCSRQTYFKLDIRCFEFPSPPTILGEVLRNLTFHVGHPEQIRVGADLLQTLIEHFNKVNFSIDDVKKLVHISLFDLCCSSESESMVICDEESESRLPIYVSILRLLFQLTNELPQKFENDLGLHIKLQLNSDFFTDKNECYSTWTSIWATWSADELIAALRTILDVVEDYHLEIIDNLKNLLSDLTNIDEKVAEMRRSVANDSADSSNSPAVKQKASRMSYQQMQERLKERMSVGRQFDILRSYRQEFVKLATELFSSYLTRFDSWPEMKGCLLHGGTDLLVKACPVTNDAFEKCLTLSRLTEDKSKSKHTQLDICSCYRALMYSSQTIKSVHLADWLNHFVADIESLPNVDNLTRFFKCVGELELMGIVKISNNRNTSRVNCLYVPSVIPI
ncbi:hypothetical protein AB6A40_002854 [Gnathostoma spinigerum]|uniref:Origin recognition complex subunit 3 N-terminal domain-containing protein n=1 Tax=Gnathostoma spinigerum TaxID=75299 RepID=A0ABD6E7S7_9BILA